LIFFKSQTEKSKAKRKL